MTSLSDRTFVNPHLGADGGDRAFALVPASAPRPLPSAPVDLPVEITGAGTTMGLDAFLERTHTTALVVVVDGTVVLERYRPGVTASDLLLGASMSKSVLATLVGLAVTEGRLDLDANVGDVVPELADRGYAACNVRDVVTMTSGVAWAEDYRTVGGDGQRLLQAVTPGGEGARALAASLPTGDEPGTRWRYCTPDSLVLDWVRERVTGQPHAAALASLWRALGCETDAMVGLDGSDPEVALAGMAVTAAARDWARVGLLQLDGTWAGERLLSEDWVRGSTIPTLPFMAPGRLPSDITTHAGFAWHWWPLDQTGELAMADGSRGQLTLVDRRRRTVVVKTSDWPYDDWLVDRQARDLSYLALPAIARAAADADASR